MSSKVLFRFSSLSILLSLIFGFILPIEALAVSSSSISMDVVPEYPSPYQDVTLSLASYVSNLDTVLISWSVDGRNVLSGIGKKTYSLKAPANNTEVAVLATIFLPDGEIEKRVIIRPSAMVLLWQANDSYVPPFYRGKALPSMDSEIKVVAMPELKNNYGLGSGKNFTYAWKKDYTNMQEESGYGKNSFLYVNDYLEDSNNISVTAATVDQKYSSAASIDISTSEPKILFYKNDSSLGTIWERELPSRYSLQGDETIVAIPYFISPKEIRNPRLVWNWFINDSPIFLQGLRKNMIALKTEVGTSGISSLKLEIENKDKIFQTTSKEMIIEF